MTSKAVWLKCHLVCGVKTNIVAAVDIGDSNSADTARFIPLLKATTRTFTVKEISADGAYTGTPNMEAAVALGMMSRP